MLIVGLGATAALAANGAEVIVASGKLDGQFLADSLFHVGQFWLKVASKTEFHRWLEQGLDKHVVITLTTDSAPSDDVRNVRILTGTLLHGTAPTPTAVTDNVVGNLPEGNSPVVHILFLKDDLTGTLGAVTFETADLDTAAKFKTYDGTRVNIVIKIE